MTAASSQAGARVPAAPPQPARATLPRAFGRYLLFDRIGRGGMAEIFLARAATELGAARRVVVKEILPEYSGNEAFARMLVREAKLAARLSHQNVVQVLDLGREDGRLFIAMAYVEGYDLNQLLRQLSVRRLPLPAEFALFIVRETLTALDYAHRAVDERGLPLAIVHCDVSPSNVLISFDGEVSLCDFGIARALAAEPEADGLLPRTGGAEGGRIPRARIAGKSAYMAPEHARGEDVDLRCDLFAAGILLWELCAGRRLYKGSEEQMLAMARAAQVPPLPARGLPEQGSLQMILDRALEPDPASRYQSARDMLTDVEEYALNTQLMASQLRFADFLTQHFADDIVALRRDRELAAAAALARADLSVTEVESVPVPDGRGGHPSPPPGSRAPAVPVRSRSQASGGAMTRLWPLVVGALALSGGLLLLLLR